MEFESSNVIQRFLRYVKIDTQSMDGQDRCPSTEKQKDLAALLADELSRMGARDVRFDRESCYVYATIPSSLPEGKTAPVLGFIAHMDTSPAVSGKGVSPRIVKYEGGDIPLNDREGIVLSAAENPELSDYVGKHLIVTDGTTLLGADDKAGVAEIMAMAEYFLTHPDEEHGEIRIGFTPDEEVGQGVDHFDVEGFGADFAYTVDGGPLGELEYENFNAASARLTVNGYSVHPGSAKNKMRNAILLAQEFQSLLPACESPEATEGYEGFYHPDSISGSVEQVVVDPSAASFIAALRQAGYPVEKADNDVLSGIRRTADLLKSGRVVICDTCADCLRELALYRWEEGREAPHKDNDHAMDDLRYFTGTLEHSGTGAMAAIAVER